MPPHLAYTGFMLLAFTVFVAARHFVPRPAALAALPAWQRLVLAWAALVGAAAGAKLGFAAAYGADWLSSGVWLADGKTVTTGLAGAYLAVEAAKLALGVTVKTGDTFALPLALALAVGRWGCFFNGCCYGLPTDLRWAVDFGDGVRRHPTQVYESFFHLTMAGVLAWMLWTGTGRFQQLKLYLIAYGVFRFATEWLRPEPVAELGLTFYQWVCMGMVVALALQWAWDRGRTSRCAAAH